MKKVIYGLAIVLVLLASVSCGRNDDEEIKLKAEIENAVKEVDSLCENDLWEISKFDEAIGKRFTVPNDEKYTKDEREIYHLMDSVPFNIYSEKGIQATFKALFCELLRTKIIIRKYDNKLSYYNYCIKKLELENARLKKSSNLKQLEEDFSSIEEGYMINMGLIQVGHPYSEDNNIGVDEVLLYVDDDGIEVYQDKNGTQYSYDKETGAKIYRGGSVPQ